MRTPTQPQPGAYPAASRHSGPPQPPQAGLWSTGGNQHFQAPGSAPQPALGFRVVRLVAVRVSSVITAPLFYFLEDTTLCQLGPSVNLVLKRDKREERRTKQLRPGGWGGLIIRGLLLKVSAPLPGGSIPHLFQGC